MKPFSVPVLVGDQVKMEPCTMAMFSQLLVDSTQDWAAALGSSCLWLGEHHRHHNGERDREPKVIPNTSGPMLISKICSTLAAPHHAGCVRK